MLIPSKTVFSAVIYIISVSGSIPGMNYGTPDSGRPLRHWPKRRTPGLCYWRKEKLHSVRSEKFGKCDKTVLFSDLRNWFKILLWVCRSIVMEETNIQSPDGI